MTALTNGSSRAMQWSVWLLMTIAAAVVGGFVTWLSKLGHLTW